MSDQTISASDSIVAAQRSGRRFKQVDVFTDQVGLGNPVAVVFDADDLSDAAMAEFARWTNLSETTFVLTPDRDRADYQVRIFTPGGELPFAGHPTIGTCFAWLEAGGVPARPGAIVQQCPAGLIRLRPTASGLAFATPPLTRSGLPSVADLDHAVDALGIAAGQVVDSAWADNGPGWLAVQLSDVDTLRALTPSLDVGDKIGVVALTGHAEPAIEVRAFFYAGATREDPVTGSLNGSLAQWLLGNGTLRAPYRSSQGRALGRDGIVDVTEADGEIWIGGVAVTGIDGTVYLR